jgi:tetratricopeptide (TPR) repeat protein
MRRLSHRLALLNTQGRIFVAEEKWDEAEAAFRKAIEIEPDNINTYRPLLLLYQRQNKTEEARALLEELNEKLPDNPDRLSCCLPNFTAAKVNWRRWKKL